MLLLNLEQSGVLLRLRALLRRNRLPKRVMSTTSYFLRKIRACLMIGLKEFHRTQCFFSIAFQMATIASIYAGAIASTTLGQAIVNLAFLENITQSNLACVTLLYWLLRLDAERSLYFTTLSLCTFLLTLTSRFLLQAQDKTGNVGQIQLNQKFVHCGGFDPTWACMPSNSNGLQSQKYPGGHPVKPSVCTCLSNHLRHSRMPAAGLKTDLYASAEFCQAHNGTKLRLEHKIVRFFCLIVRFLTAYLMLAFVLLGLSLNLERIGFYIYEGQIDTTNWSFGQIIAVTVWAQPMMEFLQVTLREFVPLQYVYSLTDSTHA